MSSDNENSTNDTKTEQFYQSLSFSARMLLGSKEPEEEKLKFLNSLMSELGSIGFHKVLAHYVKDNYGQNLLQQLLNSGQYKLLDYYHDHNIVSPYKTFKYLLDLWPKSKDFIVDYYAKDEKKNLSPHLFLTVLSERDLAQDSEGMDLLLSIVERKCDLNLIASMNELHQRDFMSLEELKYNDKGKERFKALLEKIIFSTQKNSLSAETVKIISSIELTKEAKSQLLDLAVSYPPNLYISLQDILATTPEGKIANKLDSILSKFEEPNLFYLSILRYQKIAKEYQNKELIALNWLTNKINSYDFYPLSLPYNYVSQLLAGNLDENLNKKTVVYKLLASSSLDLNNFVQRFIFDKNSFSDNKEVEKELLTVYLEHFQNKNIHVPTYNKFLMCHEFPQYSVEIEAFFEKQELSQLIKFDSNKLEQKKNHQKMKL